MAKGVQSGNVSQVATKLYHHGLITILVKKKLEEKGVTWEVFLKEFRARGVENPASMSTIKKQKAETSSPTMKRDESTPVKAEKKIVENTPPVAKKRKTRSSVRRKTISQGMNQSSSAIIIKESPQVSPTIHNISVLADAVAHTVEDEENAEDEVLLSTFFSGLRKRKTTLSTSEVQEEGY